ncbi:MAG: hypothetical protein E5Y73_17410 [Mesorhizobium sp.]|uniref:AP2 domain-containing protein n=1 Tax=Mesorhizobium sp. TaxID=1871066 RepID=UPI00120A1B13|nr:AP2 domain-containing protein [Mesorhizobium sp.]TIL91455.1 MAG: hypothetical protein E5Y73_17410 [Mesorhizobium sp.]
MNDFYVYAWRRPDTDEIFYIGKGRCRRDVGLKRHNPIFMNIVAKLKRCGYEPIVERLYDHLSEDEAFRLESFEIASRGRRDNQTGGLSNLTDGGEGRSGSVKSESERARLSAALRGIPRTDEWLAKMSYGLLGNQNARGATRSKETRAKMSESQRALPPPSAETRSKIATTVSKVTRMSPPRSDNTSGFKGVAFSIGRNKWQAGIYIDGKRRPLGRFATKEEAARAYDKAAFTAWGDGCYLNFPRVADNDNRCEEKRIAA